MDPIRKIPKKVTKKFVSKVINRQYFHRKTGLKTSNSEIHHFVLKRSSPVGVLRKLKMR